MGRIATSPRRSSDEHLLDIQTLELRFNTDITMGLSSEFVNSLRTSPNMLPTDVETGHGSIHELVAVVRDGNVMHTRADNLVVGDVVTLKENQCVPADIRLVECDDMYVDNRALSGEKVYLPRSATTLSVFDPPGLTVPYMEAQNVVFYGTTIVKGTGKGVVIRTGAETVLGVISNAILHRPEKEVMVRDIKLVDEMRQFGVSLKNEQLPSNFYKTSAIVVEATDIFKRTVVTCSFGTNLPAIVTGTDMITYSETISEELELAIVNQINAKYNLNNDAKALVHALSSCQIQDSSANKVYNANQERDQEAIRRFCELFNQIDSNSPLFSPITNESESHTTANLSPTTTAINNSTSNSSNNSSSSLKTRCCTFVHTQISCCDVYVHFDAVYNGHVVLLQGPAREILSRCGQIRKPTLGMVKFETADLKNVESMIEGLESKKEQVISFAELYLDRKLYPKDATFDIEQINFPTSNMIYLGSLGLIEKASPELINMATHAKAADVSLIVVSGTVQLFLLLCVIGIFWIVLEFIGKCWDLLKYWNIEKY